ncbi:MAG TPA: hypothetical protein VEF03_00215 [Candidatus Binataceae bacterium]|nr:hypothetical protein [Candidatus Binataceae bacterium]
MKRDIRTLRRPIFAAALAAVAIFASGCPALMIPSLAYEGYKYEKGESPLNQQQQQTSSGASKSSSKPSSTDIE